MTTKKSSTKRSLLMSVLSLFLCVAMLAGTTFAWFTDSVASKNNVIVAGNLDIELEYKTVRNGVLSDKWETVQDKDDIFDKDAYWEPGRTEVVYLKVSNLGSLALKYQLGVNVVNDNPGTNVYGEPFYLSDYLVFKTVILDEEPTASTYTRDTAVVDDDAMGFKDYNGKTTALEAKSDDPTVNDEDYVALIVYMPETVDNKANHKASDDPLNPAKYAASIVFGISVLATQYTAEEDSFGDDYDEDAWHEKFKVTSAADLNAALENAKDGDVIVFANNIESVDGALITDKKITIDLNGQTYTVSDGASTNNRNLKINGTSEVTIKNGTMVANGSLNAGAYGTIRTEGSAKVTLENVKLYNYRGNGLNVKALGGTTVVINNSEIYSQYGGGVEAAGGYVELNNVKIEQKGMWSAPYNSMAVSVNGGGKATINSGVYSTACLTAEEANNQGSSHGPWTVGVLNSGGTLEINGGTFSNDNFGDNSLATYARGLILADTGANVEINGGTFNAVKAIVDVTNNLGDASRNPSVTLRGGVFSADPTVSGLHASYLIKLADNHSCVEYNDFYYVLPGQIDSIAFNAADLATAITNGGNVYVMNDIDMANAWTSVKPTRALTILGNDKTITNLNLPLLVGGVSTEVTIKNLTVADSNIAPAAFENGLGSAALIPYVDAYGNATLEDCHVKNSSISSNYRAGGLVGYTSGQTLTIKDCSVEGCSITGVKGAAGLVSYSQSVTKIENSSVKDSNMTATEDRGGSAAVAGAVIGTVNANTTLTNVTVSGNTVSNNNAAAVFSDCIGRYSSGSLSLDGTHFISDAASLSNALANAANGNKILLNGDVTLDNALSLANDVNVELDLGGHTITGSLETLFNVSAGQITIKNGSIKNVKDSATETMTTLLMSGNAVAEIKDVTIETTGIGIHLKDDAKITELNANINSYMNANGSYQVIGVFLGDNGLDSNARIDKITGGSYSAGYTEAFANAYTGSYSGLEPLCAISIQSADASIGEISGGTFLGTYLGNTMQGATIDVKAGKIEKISGGYFGYCKNTMRNYPYGLVYVANGASIDAITGGSFECATRIYNDFNNVVDASGCKVAVRPEKVTVTVKLSTSVKTENVAIWDVVAK